MPKRKISEMLPAGTVRAVLGQVLLLSLLWVLGTGLVAATEIYKSVDENGNVVYSDQPPRPGAEPLVLPEPNIINSVPAEPRPINRDSGDGIALPELVMLTPTDEETFWGTAQSMEVSFDVMPEMRQGLQIAIYVDDEQEAIISSTKIVLDEITRGTHTIRAELLDSRGNVLSEVAPRTFFMKQYSTNFQ